jgi:hypothetical protein
VDISVKPIFIIIYPVVILLKTIDFPAPIEAGFKEESGERLPLRRRGSMYQKLEFLCMGE